jgi:hypothetical protein
MQFNTIHSPSHTYCQNCGTGSHCGGPRYTTVQDYIVDGGEYRELKICDHCRCNECIPEIKPTPKTYNIKKLKKNKESIPWDDVIEHCANLSKR